MWFFLTRQIVFTKRLAASRDKVLAALDPDTVLGGNSILTSVIPDAGNANAAPGAVLGFTIVEKVPLVFGLSTSTKFHCQWTNVADGADLEVNAGAGTHLATRLRASEDVDAGETEYSDHVTVTVRYGLYWCCQLVGLICGAGRGFSCSCRLLCRGRRGAILSCGT